jgi:hypothetical protein
MCVSDNDSPPRAIHQDLLQESICLSVFRIWDPFDRNGWTSIVSLVEFENYVSVYASAVQKVFECQVTVSLFIVRVGEIRT